MKAILFTAAILCCGTTQAAPLYPLFFEVTEPGLPPLSETLKAPLEYEGYAETTFDGDPLRFVIYDIVARGALLTISGNMDLLGQIEPFSVDYDLIGRGWYPASPGAFYDGTVGAATVRVYPRAFGEVVPEPAAVCLAALAVAAAVAMCRRR